MNYPIIAPKPSYETLQVFVFQSWRRYEILGRYIGNINDEDFAKKLARVRGRLWLKNVSYSESPYPEVQKEVKRMNDMERYNRKMSKVFAEYWRQIDKLNGLFRDSEIKLLAIKYKATVSILKKRYNQ